MPTHVIVRTRGQTIILGVLTLLTLAVMMMLTFTVNTAVHEKIRLQSHSDSVAFSVAVIEARAFNSMVYSNRAIAACVVAEMTVHAWMTTATATSSVLFSGAIAFIMIAIEELGQSFCPIVCFCAIHCVHMVQAFIVMAKYFQKWSDYNNKIKDAEEKFNKAVETIKKAVDDIHKDQLDVLDSAKDNIASIPGKLKDINIKNGENVDFSGQNQTAFACALEGSKFDDDCSEPAVAGKDVRSKIIQNTANAMRPMYDQLLMTMDNHDDFKMSGSDFLKDIQQNEGDPMVMKFGSAYTGDSKSMFSSNSAESKNVGGWVITMFMSGQWHDGFGVMAMPAWVFSDKDNGDHFGSWAHSGNHEKFAGVDQEDPPCNNANCFVNFRANADKDKDFGQPSIFSGAKYNTLGQRMSAQGKDGNHWMLNDQGHVALKLSSGTTAEIALQPRHPGIAISKAKTYFHQPGDWTSPPNFFDPFWRAKLHPFSSREEAKNTASTAGDNAGADNAAKVPVEGAEN
jgi:hypothetical protein